jgi:predicted amidohydrolase
MASDYQATFGALAKEFDVTVIAGSIALQNPAIIDGAITTRPGLIHNVSAVFRPDGTVHPFLVFKRHPIPAELSFLSPGAQPMPAFETPIGRVGVLICADSWHPELYEELAANKVGAVAVPAYIAEDGAWTKPWGGYVTPEPGDVAHGDVGALSEGDAWRKYALPARIGGAGGEFGATAFLRGGPWDLGADGRTLAVAGDSAFVGEKVEGGVVSVVWR